MFIILWLDEHNYWEWFQEQSFPLCALESTLRPHPIRKHSLYLKESKHSNGHKMVKTFILKCRQIPRTS